MNPQFILFKVILLICLGSANKLQTRQGLNTYVVQKQTTYQQNHIPIFLNKSSSDQTLAPAYSGSIMHKVSNKQKLAIFCKMEHELMKASGFAVKFRLGDQSYVDQLEGK